jgi:hypothetical protein
MDLDTPVPKDLVQILCFESVLQTLWPLLSYEWKGKAEP